VLPTADNRVYLTPLVVHGLLLGYSARVPPSSFQFKDWQRQNLLRPDVHVALSVDNMIWEDKVAVDSRIRKPTWVGYIQELWSSLGKLHSCLSTAGLQEIVDFTLIAVSVLAQGAAVREWRSRLGPIDPPAPPNEAVVIGYDVADAFLMSALCNGTFWPGEEADLLRGAWESAVNGAHLFTRKEDASAFVRTAEERLPEHAPFFIFEVIAISKGVWPVEDLQKLTWRPKP